MEKNLILVLVIFCHHEFIELGPISNLPTMFDSLQLGIHRSLKVERCEMGLHHLFDRIHLKVDLALIPP